MLARGQACKTCLFGTYLARAAGAKWQSNRIGSRPVLSRIMGAPDQLDNSLEALSNLLYLIRRSLDDPAKAKTYLDIADKVLIDIAAKQLFRRAGPPDADSEEHNAMGRSWLTSCIIVGRWNAMSTSGFASTMKQRFDIGGTFSCRLEPNSTTHGRG
jgi:hypothetical protein